MRLFIVVVALLLSMSTTAAAQSRWTVSAGPEWVQLAPNTHLWGMRLRAEYDLTPPSSVFGLRLEGGARWGPTQSYFYEFGSYSRGGTEQQTDLMLGLSAGLSPFPRARFSPYVTMGVFGRQVWTRGSFFAGDSTMFWNVPYTSRTNGDIIASLGVGLRARIAGRSLQLELRRLHSHNGLTFGTRLPF